MSFSQKLQKKLTRHSFIVFFVISETLYFISSWIFEWS